MKHPPAGKRNHYADFNISQIESHGYLPEPPGRGREKNLRELQIIEYSDMRVLTTQQIAEAYGTDAQVITNNFNRNKDRYVEGKHFVCLTGDGKAEFIKKNQNDFSSFTRAKAIYLWTKKGAFLHAKSLNTDIAWEVYDRLVDSYFDHSNLLDGMSPELKATLIVDKRVTKVEHRIDHIENDMPLFGVESDELSAHVKRKGVELLGGKKSEAYRDSTIHKRVFSDIYNQLRREFGIYDSEGKMKSYKALKRKDLADAHDFVDCYTLPSYLAEQINDCNAQIRMGGDVDGV